MFKAIFKNGPISLILTSFAFLQFIQVDTALGNEDSKNILIEKEVSQPTLEIDSRNDGCYKTDKYERDIELLKQVIKDDPNNEDCMFNLAQSHMYMKQYDEAIRWYKNRIKKGGWNEEVWYAKMMIGECYEEMGFWDYALHWYLEAYQYRPNRAEPFQKISSHYRFHNQHELAYLFAQQGLRIPYPEKDILFISHPVYDYQFDEDISISAYYIDYKNEGFNAANRLILNKKVPHHVKSTAYNNLLFYVNNLENATFQSIDIELPSIREGMAELYSPSNPSIQKIEDGYAIILRAVNYLQNGGREYKSQDPLDPTIYTRNFLLHYDRNMKLVSQHEIIENLPRNKREFPVKGLEDCRLVLHDNCYWFTCATYDTHPKTIGQTLCKLANSPTGKEIQVEKLIPIIGPDAERCEKNWLSFSKDDNLYVIYSYDPFIIYKLNRETGECETTLHYEPKNDFTHFRGSAGPEKFDDGYLTLVHEVAFTNQRYYFHRFIYLDKDFNVKKISKPFTFMHQGIEYCCGMTIDHSNTKCIMSISFEDREAYLCTVGLDKVRSMLEPLPK